MGVRRVGVELVADGAVQFARDLTNSQNAVTGIGTAATSAVNNIAPLNTAVNAVNQTLNQLQQTATTTTGTLNQTTQGTTKARDEFGRFVKTTEQAAKGMSSFNVAGIPVVLTLGDIKNAAQAAIQPFLNLGREAFGAVSAYQRLAMSMESLVAKEIRSTDATIEMTDALAMAKPRAAELLKWIQDLAINSPFSQEGVAQAFRTAQAYGFTAAEAQRLTKATIDFSSATGASSYQMDIIALALGQIKAKGKLAGQEILQLTNAGLAINPILAKMGFTMNDVSKGMVGADAFVKAFVETLESDFGGAAARTTGTLEGLTSTISDLKTVGLRELFMPFFEAVTPALSAFASALTNFMPVVTLVGQTIGNLTKFLIENREAVLTTVAAITAGVGSFLLISNAGVIATAVMTGLPAILAAVTSALTAMAGVVAFLLSPIGLLSIAVGTLAALFVISFGTMQDMVADTAAYSEARFGAMGDKLAQTSAQSTSQVVNDWGEMGDKLAQQAAQNSEASHSWGYNLVIQFANGMANAIGSIIDVLTSIGQTIAYWLSPGSPPNIAPDIDKWGESAMGEFVKGFTKADFGQLRSLSGTIKGYLDSLSDDLVPQKDIIPKLLGSREAIAAALAQIRATGSVGQDSIQKIIDTIGVASPELQAYITSLLSVEQTNLAVKAAAEGYAAAQDKVRLAQEALNAVSEEYNAILAPMNEELQAIADARQEFQEGQRISVLEGIVNDKNAPAIAKELALMELREIEIKKQIKATEKAKAIEEEAAKDAIDIAEDELDATKIVLDNAVKEAEAAQAQIDLQKEILDLQIETNKMYEDQADLLKRLMDSGEDAMDKVGEAAKGAGGKVGELAKSIGGLADGMGVLGGDGGPLDGLKLKLEEFTTDLAKPFEGIGDKLKTLKETWATVFLEMGLKLQPITDALKLAWGEGGTWEGNLDNIETILTTQWGPGGTWEGNADNLKIILDAVQVKWQEQWGEGGTWQGIMDNASKIHTSEWGTGGTWEKNTDNVGKITTRLSELWNDEFGEEGTWAGIMANATTIHNEQWGQGGTWDGIIENAKTSVSILTQKWNEQWGTNGTWQGIISNAKTVIKTNWGAGGIWDGIMDNAKLSLSLLSGKWEHHFGEGGVWTGIMDNANTIVKENWGAGGVWDGIFDNVKLGITLIKDEFNDKIELIKGFFDDMKTKIETKVSEIIDNIVLVFSTTNWATLGADIISGIVQGIIDNAMALYSALSNLISDAIADALAGIGVGGGSEPPSITPDNARSSANSFSRSFGAASLGSPISLPSTVAPPVNYNRSITNNNQQFTGIGHADVNNGMDVQALQAVIEMTVARAMSGQGRAA